MSHVTCLIRRLKDLQASAQHLDHFKNLRIQIETIFSLSNYGIWILDGEGVVLKVNQVAPELIGLQEKDVERGHCPVKNHPRNCASFKYQPVNRYPQTQKTSAEFAVTHAVNTTQFYLKEKGIYGISVPVSSLAKFRK